MRAHRLAAMCVALGVALGGCATPAANQVRDDRTGETMPAAGHSGAVKRLEVLQQADATEMPREFAPHVPETLGTGRCESLAVGAVGLENDTGHLPNAYRAIGETFEGRTIWAEHWGSFDGPQVLVLAQVHGDECSGAFVAQEIRTRPPVSWGVWLVASMNPDGFVRFSRRNAKNVDLNRDGVAKTQPETRAVLAFTREIRPVLSVHLHTPLAWIGSHNGGVAASVADVIAEKTGLEGNRRAGGGRGFLWEGQAEVLPGHPSVLVELPAATRHEASAVFERGDGRLASVEEVRSMAVGVRDSLTAVFGP